MKICHNYKNMRRYLFAQHYSFDFLKYFPEVATYLKSKYVGIGDYNNLTHKTNFKHYVSY